MFEPRLLAIAAEVLALCRVKKLRLATAESCTGGLVAGVLTAIPGSSDVVERGFVTYSNLAKAELLGVPKELLAACGAVSPETAVAMAEGALAYAPVDITVAVTGIAGPDGGSPGKPIGLVHLASARRHLPTIALELRLGNIGRSEVRLRSVQVALDLVRRQAALDP